MVKAKDVEINRRAFLKNAAAGAVLLVTPPATPAKTPAAAPAKNPPPAMSRKAEVEPPAPVEVLTEERSGSDFMVDVIKSLGIEYVCSNPGSSFRGLHESLINYGGNKNPEFITCTHEESSVGMAHGYAKVEGKPLVILAHGTVGLQHAAMAVYNAYCDRVPVVVIGGNILDATKRIPPVEWSHSVQDAAAILRDFTKWDDSPVSLQHFAESTVRAYKLAMTPPMMPVVLVADGELQENPISSDAKFHIPSMVLPAAPQGEIAAVNEAAKMLVAAENPVIVVDRTIRSADGMDQLVELAETLQAAVVDHAGRMNFPNLHGLNQTQRARAEISNADVILGLELNDFWGTVHSYRDQMERTYEPVTRPGVKRVSIGAGGQIFKSNYQDFQRYPELDLDIAGDAQATLPSLIEAVKKQLDANRGSSRQARGQRLGEARQQTLAADREAATYAWDASPVSTARLCAELWAQIRNEDWTFLSESFWVSGWPMRLWNFDKYHRHIGGSGGYGIGYCSPASVGAALANRKYGRLSVSILCDGDLMYGPGVLWTAAHHRIPLLAIVHNNHAYHQEVMQVQIMANRHNRGIDRARIGTTMTDPVISFAKLAQGLGVYAEGPVADPKDLGPALRRALAVVKKGEPALVDVHTQPR
ncbi:MAG TPA: thiamine pyrophosphate-binding protein [Terriglobales bacterium]|nr:thiamine pyrophosphate-binding protein [Terriglobales bacterium]